MGTNCERPIFTWRQLCDILTRNIKSSSLQQFPTWCNTAENRAWNASGGKVDWANRTECRTFSFFCSLTRYDISDYWDPSVKRKALTLQIWRHCSNTGNEFPGEFVRRLRRDLLKVSIQPLILLQWWQKSHVFKSKLT